MKYDAFFISPEGEMASVFDRHIVTISKDPKFFGLTLDHIKTVYKKHKENVGWEGYARNEIILNLLKKEWVRIRFNFISGTWRLQIHEELTDKLKNNILTFCQEIKKGNITNLMQRTADPNIEIFDTSESSIFQGRLDEALEYLCTGV